MPGLDVLLDAAKVHRPVHEVPVLRRHHLTHRVVEEVRVLVLHHSRHHAQHRFLPNLLFHFLLSHLRTGRGTLNRRLLDRRNGRLLCGTWFDLFRLTCFHFFGGRLVSRLLRGLRLSAAAPGFHLWRGRCLP